MVGLYSEMMLKSLVMDWQDKTTVKKGDLGENICRELLQMDGYVVYKSITDGMPHLIDFFCHKESKNIIGAEVKAKSRTIKCFWGNIPGTGCNLKSYNEYLHLQEKHSIDIKMYFVDQYEECIYGGWLSDITPGLKHLPGGQVVFRLDLMQVFYNLSASQVEELKRLTKPGISYSGVKRHFCRTNSDDIQKLPNPIQLSFFNH